ncbi:MAG: hypothetical protein M1820_007018 [Bogoriella megaspora]|nr:MAG: hypothetical protein M1820_007018 [Bogoriella megaspora]
MDLFEKYDAYGGQGPKSVRTGLSLGALATILIILRIYVRLRISTLGTTALFWAIAAWVLTVVTQTFGVLAALHGLGNHITVLLETGETHNFLKFTWLTVFFFCIAIATGKAAVAVFLLEVTGQAYARIRWTLITLAVANFTVAVPVAIYSQLHCSPPSALWDPLQQDKCNAHAYVIVSYVIGSVAAVSDLALALLPILILWSLQIDRRLKQVLCVLLGLGVFAAVAAMVRTWASTFLEGDDASCTLFVWGEVEEWLVIIAMSIPPTWPLFKPYCERFVGMVSRKSSHFSGGKHYSSKKNGASSEDVMRIHQEREFELSSERRLSRDTGDTKRNAYLEIEEDEERSVRTTK